VFATEAQAMLYHSKPAGTDGRSPLDLDAIVVSLEGEFDLAERARLLDAFAVTTSSPIVIINFEKTRYLDSTVLQCLVALQRTILERGGKLILVGLRPELKRIFDLCSLERVFQIRDKLADVMAAFALNPQRTRKLALIAESTTSLDAVDMHGRQTQ
jgi:anti-sigma B factor antagonist